MVFAINAGRRAVGFPVPLAGFDQAYAGAPVDNKQYGEARRALMQQIAAAAAGASASSRRKQMEEQQEGRSGDATAASGARSKPDATLRTHGEAVRDPRVAFLHCAGSDRRLQCGCCRNSGR